VAVDDGVCHVEELPVRRACVLAEHRERTLFVDRMTFHQDAFGSFSDGTASECALQILVLGEAAEHDVDRALPLFAVPVGDVREYASLGGLPDERGIGRVKERDNRAGRLLDDLLDQPEGVFGAVAESHERDVGPLSGGHRTHVGDVDLTGDHFVPQRGNDRRDKLKTVPSLVRDQDTEMLGLAMAHVLCARILERTAVRALESLGFGCYLPFVRSSIRRAIFSGPNPWPAQGRLQCRLESERWEPEMDALAITTDATGSRVSTTGGNGRDVGAGTGLVAADPLDRSVDRPARPAVAARAWSSKTIVTESS
jgi:hypothetical protein